MTPGFRWLFPNWLRSSGTALDGACPEDRASLSWLRDLFADRAFWAVALVWAICWMSWAIYLDRFANSLPWCDEYAFVLSGVATREKPVTWEFLWTPANEHRAPLTRLWGVALGRTFNWNFRPMLQADLAVLALGCLTLVLAARAVRGQSHLCDSFLPLVVLTSAHHQTLANYVYAYAMALAVWCATASAVLVKWHQRSMAHLLLYIVGALIVAWAGGPAGNLWALGLCVPLILGCFERCGLVWKACALLGACSTAVSSAFLIYKVPEPPPVLLAFHSDSWKMTFKAASKLSVGWMGNAILQVIWPWALLALIVPLLFLLGRFVVDVRRLRASAVTRWLDLNALLIAALLVLVAMAQARAKYPELWNSRYCALEVPIAVILFLMLVRAAAPKALLSILAMGMLVCVAWNWPSTIELGRAARPRQIVLSNELRVGREPLSLLVERYPDATGWCKEWGCQHMLSWWARMRFAGISVFGKEANLAQRCPFRHADSGTLTGTLHTVADPLAVEGHAIQAEGEGAAATAVYEITIPTTQVYKLCCRWQTPVAGRQFAVAVDGGVPMTQYVPNGPEYVPCVLVPMMTLEAGTHRFSITWPGPGSRLDVLELTPQ